MSDDKSVEFQLLRLEMKEDSLETFPQEERIDITLSDEQVYMKAMEMGTESLVYNVLIPYRNTLALVEKNYNDMEIKARYVGFDMIAEPFIPEYLSFEQLEKEDGTIYYVKDSFVLTSVNGEWIVFSNILKPTKIIIDNMLQGYHVLLGLGAKVTIDEYLSEE